MRKILWPFAIIATALVAAPVTAAGPNALGISNIAFKLDYFAFTEDVFEDVDLEDGVYFGLEGYGALSPNLYLGGEVGWASASNEESIGILGESIDVDTDVTLIPLELNLKYAIEMAPQWTMGLGAGVSYNYFDVELDVGGDSADESDWIWGGQLFADLNYRMGNQWFVGLNAKYQFTEDLEFDVGDRDIETDTSADNWRVGAQIGFEF